MKEEDVEEGEEAEHEGEEEEDGGRGRSRVVLTLSAENEIALLLRRDGLTRLVAIQLVPRDGQVVQVP